METETVAAAASTRVAWHVASHEAVRAGSLQIEPVHLFHAMLNLVDGVIDPRHRAAVLAALDEEPTLAEDIRAILGVASHDGLTRIRRAVQRSLPRAAGAVDDGRAVRRSTRCREVFDLAVVRAVRDGSSTLSLIHLVGALVDDPPGDVAPFLPSRDSGQPPLVWESRVRAFADEFHLTRITLLVSGIEGSGLIRRRFGDLESAKMFRAHDTIFREELRACHGREIRTAGDGFLLAFPDELEAVELALRVQARLRAHQDLGAIPLRVGIGIHSGSMHQAMEIAAGIAALASGNQILMDGDVYGRAMQKLHEIAPDRAGELEDRDHGDYDIKGMNTRLRIFEVSERGKAISGGPGMLDVKGTLRGSRHYPMRLRARNISDSIRR